MGAVSAALAEGADFVYEDKTYKVHPCTYEVQAAFERYLEGYAIDTYYKLSRKMSVEDSDKMLAQLHRDISMGFYSFGSKAVREALDSKVHLRHMVFLMLKKNHPEVTVELVREMFDAQGDRLMLSVNLANADPNRQSPETKQPNG